MDPHEQRKEELETLQTLYEDEDFTFSEDAKAFSGTFRAHPRLPENQPILFVIVKSKHHSNVLMPFTPAKYKQIDGLLYQTFSVSHLPPPSITFTLPLDYPDSVAPQLT